MSWAEVKKINSNLKIPLDKLLKQNRIFLPSVILPDKWETKEPMTSARYGFASAVVDGLIYCIGGVVSTYAKVNEAYNPKTGVWTSKAAMTTGRGSLAACEVNGIIYCIGGSSGSTSTGANESYNPVTNTWTARLAMNTKREFFVSCEVNGIIYCIGGRPFGSSSLSANEAYNPVTNTWTAKADMPTARSGLGAAVVDGIIYCIGGLKDGASQYFQLNEAYNPVTNTWSSKAIMPAARYSFGTALANNGTIYCIGGTGSSSAGYNAQTINEAYNAHTNMWTVKTPMPTGRYQFAARVVDGVVYCIGGYASNAGLAINEAYSLKEIILCPVNKGDMVYSVTEVYTQNQSVVSNTVTEIQSDGYLYTNTDFIFGWILKGE